TDYAVNLFNCPTVAYSGEIDKQKQAADIMAKAMAAEGLTLEHVIGPRTGHAYHPQAKEEINRRVDSIAARGRNPVPKRVRFTTWTLRYNQMLWVTVDGLGKHWERARGNADIVSPARVLVTTDNVTALTLSMPAGLCPLDNTAKLEVEIDGGILGGEMGGVKVAPVLSDRSWTVHLRKDEHRWNTVDTPDETTLAKRHG